MCFQKSEVGSNLKGFANLLYHLLTDIILITMKYGRALILIIIYFVMGSVPLFAIPSDSFPFTTLLPGSNAGIQVTTLFFLYPLIILGFGVLFGYLIAPLYLVLHKTTIGRHMTYGIGRRSPPENKKIRKLGQGLFPGLVAINFAIMLLPYLSDNVLYDYVSTWGGSQATFFAFLVSLLFTAMPASILFAGVWFLEDASIAYSNQAKVKDTGGIIEIRSVGGWYQQFLKGYAGIGAIFTYLIIITNFWSSMQGVTDPLSTLLLLAIIAPIPIYATMAVLPTILVLEFTRTHRTSFILNFAQKLGITEEIAYPLT